jgi:ABC-2 type transport system ATP-binding protein
MATPINSKYPRNAIVVKHVSKSFGAKKALDDVSFSVPHGSIFGFLGPNGAGKTTSIRCMMDFIRPDSGSITLLGKDAYQDSATLKQSIGFLSSDSELNPNWTGEEHINFFESLKGQSKTRQQLVERLGLDVKTKVKALSSGNKQKLAIVLCFVGDPQLIIMDEPTRGLDPILQNELYEILQEFTDQNKTVFLSSHNLGEVQRICDAVLLIKDGQVVETKTMGQIRDMHVHVVTAATDKTFDSKKLHSLANVEIVTETKSSVSLKVKGDLNQLLKVLTAQHLTDISVTHASLEDIFLKEYRS